MWPDERNGGREPHVRGRGSDHTSAILLVDSDMVVCRGAY